MTEKVIDLGRGVRIVGESNAKQMTQLGGVTILPHAKYVEHQPVVGFEVSVDTFDPDNPGTAYRHLPPLDVGRLPEGWTEKAFALAASKTDDDVLKRELAYAILAKWQAEADEEAAIVTKPSQPPPVDEFVRPGAPAAAKPPVKLQKPVVKPKKQPSVIQESVVAKPKPKAASVQQPKPTKAAPLPKPLPKLPQLKKKVKTAPPPDIAQVLNIPGLLLQTPGAPTISAKFDFGAVGKQRATYHWASATESVLLLIYDTRFPYADPFIPPSLGMEQVVDIQLLMKGSEETYAYRCFGQNTTFDFGVFTFVMFVRELEDEVYGLAEQENAVRQMQLNGDDTFTNDEE